MDSANRVILTGYFSQTITFGGVNIPSQGLYDGFIAAFVCGIAYHYFRHSRDVERELELLTPH